MILKTILNIKKSIKMKTMKISKNFKLLLFGTLLLGTIASCKKDDSDGPKDYVGDWVTEKTVETVEGSLDLKDIVKFKESTFTETVSMYDPISDEWINMIGRKGDFTAEDGEMDVTITAIGYSTEDDITGYPTGNIVYYKDGTDEFDELLVELEMSKNYKALYTIEDDKLTLKADDNNNGKYDDEDEVNIFTRKKP